MTSMISPAGHVPSIERASRNFARLMRYVAGLYSAGSTSSLSAFEAHQLTASVSYALGIMDSPSEETARVLDVDDPIELWHEKVAALTARTNAVYALWEAAVLTMLPICNVSLRDTLASLSEVKRRYDVRFAAHEVPCDIDYQLHDPIDPALRGIDYIEAWLACLLDEARWIAQFDVSSCIAVLERVCPDYRGLHINLYDLLQPHEDELRRRN